MRIGANYIGKGRCEFTAWAPFAGSIDLKIVTPEKRVIPLQRIKNGYWATVIDEVIPGLLYLYCLDRNRDRSDPASHFQPEGVHGPSQVIDHKSFKWEDSGWKGIPLSEMIMYELHVGTFTDEGSFEAVIQRIDDLFAIGINAIEIMPVAQFPGERNWGYDGTYPYAVQNSYGGPEGLKRLVNECHKRGIAVILDVVYNHLGPEGNYLWDYGPYFTDRYKTPWGQAINYDGLYSNEVRNFFIENALHWFKNYHIDALRLDAIHGIYDFSAKPFLQELAESIEEFSSREGKKYYLIAESDLNDSRIVRPRNMGGYGIDAQWCDDFHHAVHTLLTAENQGYYIDFGDMEDLTKSLKEGFVYSGQYSEYRKRNHGNSSGDCPSEQFIVFAQNHDQVGNRMFGERLSNLVSFESLKLAAGVVLLSPYVPLLFMGEEYGEDNPFLYFVNHSDAELIEAVRRGRKEEFKAFKWQGDLPDPQSVETFLKSKIEWDKRYQGKHKVLRDFYKELIQLRRTIPAFANPDKKCIDVFAVEGKKIFSVRRWNGGSEVYLIFNFDNVDMKVSVSPITGQWKKFLDTSEEKWNGPGTSVPERIRQGDEITLKSMICVLYIRERPQ
jgi:maltooligosyltrehalose trehalohydrolase